MIQLGELIVILELHRQGLSISAIARRTGRDAKTVAKYIERGLELPAYRPRQVGRPSKLAPFVDYLRERTAAFPDLSAVRLTREIRERGYTGAYTAIKRFLATIRPEHRIRPFEVRSETPAGQQAQVDFARFVTEFTGEPGVTRIVWLFSLVLGHSRFIFARFVMHQDMQTLLRSHMQAFAAIGGVPIEILYDRMKTAVTGEDEGKVERPFSYIRQDFFLARTFRNLDDLNTQLDDWLATVANIRLHGTTQKIVSEAFRAEQPELQALPAMPFNALIERRVSNDGLVSISGNYYSVPDRTRRIVEVHQLPDVIRILDAGRLVAEHPVLEGRRRTHVVPGHLQGRASSRPWISEPGSSIGRPGDRITSRSLDIYQAIANRLSATGGRS